MKHGRLDDAPHAAAGCVTPKDAPRRANAARHGPVMARHLDLATAALLFLPVSGPGGAGEFYRALAIATALCVAGPIAAIQFVVSRDAPYAHHAPYPTVLVGRSPTRRDRSRQRDHQPGPTTTSPSSTARVASPNTSARIGSAPGSCS